MAGKDKGDVKPQKIAVIGAGIVGVSTALILQSEGHEVMVIDPKPPGTGTSFGNAGAIAVGSVYPMSNMRILKKVPKMMMDPMSPLRVDWKYFPRALPWLLRFVANCPPSKVDEISIALRELTKDAGAAHKRLTDKCKISDIVKPVGWLTVFSSAEGLKSMDDEIAVCERRGVIHDRINADELRQLEPGLAPKYTHGAFKPEGSFVTSPIKMTEAYAAKFVELGGKFIQETVTRFEVGANGPTQVVTDLAIHDIDAVVISAGARSGPLAKMLGSSVPLDTERGYHLMIEMEKPPELNRPVSVGDHGFVLAPMEEGVRVTTGAEIAGVDAPPDFDLIYRMLPHAREALPGLDGKVGREWLGFRPSMPDSKPVISKSPKHPNVYFGFGHGHIGLTLAARTGELISDMIAGRDSGIDLSKFRADRY